MASINQFLRLFFFALFLVSQAISRPLDTTSTTTTTTSGSLAMRERHEQWMARHGRVYTSVAEKEKRFHIFENNVKHIEKFNSDGVNKSYKLATNAFSDLTNEEFLSTHTGFNGQLPDNINSGSSISMFSYDNLTDVQDSVDWREKNVVTPIKYQGSCGCCWAFSSVAVLEGIYAIKTGNLVSFSEQNLVDCNEENHGCSGGYMTNAFKYIESQGINSEEEYPYEGTQGQCKADQTQSVTISDYKQVPSGDTDSLMAAVNQQPVSVALDASSFKNYAGGIYDGGCGDQTNHVVTVIGYGTDDVSGMSYWIIKNSWGQNWGEKGYMRLLMDENVCPITKFASFPVM